MGGVCSQDNFNCFYCTVLYAQILLAGNGRDMHLLVTMTYDLSDVYASDWSARRYDLTGDCDSPDTFTDCHGLHRPDDTLDQVNGCYEPSISHPRNKGPCTTNLCCVLCDTACNIYI